mgnify:CR=1 FL=1
MGAVRGYHDVDRLDGFAVPVSVLRGRCRGEEDYAPHYVFWRWSWIIIDSSQGD